MYWVIQHPVLILGALAATGFAYLWWLLNDERRKLRMLLGGPGTGETDIPRELIRRVARAEAKLEELDPRVHTIESIATTSIQKVGFLRFNPFQDTGGDHSFILALLDREHNGVVLSSLYLRESTRLYAKQIKKGNPVQQLSSEEIKVLEETLNQS